MSRKAVDFHPDKDSKIFVAGHRGLVGSAIVRSLQRRGYNNILTRTRQQLDLADGQAVASFFAEQRPDCVIDAAAKVGGIHANDSYPAEFIRDNLFIQNNLIDNAWRFGCKKFVFLGSTCIYPRMAPQPLKEEYLLTGPLEPTNEWYAIAKIAGIKMCQAYRRQYGFDAISLMPTNLYGPGDNFDLENSHVLPALISKFHEARQAGQPQVVIWGTGKPRREFLHVDDMADATVFLMESYSEEQIVNVGVGQDISIGELAGLVKEIVGYRGSIVFDTTRPDGTPRKLLDISRLAALGWRASIPLEEGIESTYRWYVQNRAA
ncbi:MAG TPA: GDP-L-fucose synthase [Gammaproteobacteria bacterium]|nr:GDP-L-fucose synthase [Gammaproteobacteria bacterium]